MKVAEVTFAKSAQGAADLPRDRIPRIALVGRSNVGKSSLINALTRRKIARTSAAAGKTRLINLYLIDLVSAPIHRLYLVDLPGYGYARGGSDSVEAFERMAREYFAHAEESEQRREGDRRSSVALLIVDARHPGLESDITAHLWLKSNNLPSLVLASKIDKLGKADRVRALRAWENTLSAEVVGVSATTGEGLDAAWKRMLNLLSPRPTDSPKPTLPHP
jgi:GTP-binding protein